MKVLRELCLSKVLLEQQLNQLECELKNLGLSNALEPLRDVGGFPRADLDLAAVLPLRKAVAMKKADLKVVVSCLEKALKSGITLQTTVPELGNSPLSGIFTSAFGNQIQPLDIFIGEFGMESLQIVRFLQGQVQVFCLNNIDLVVSREIANFATFLPVPHSTANGQLL
jgi:hypothetical protein